METPKVEPCEASGLIPRSHVDKCPRLVQPETARPAIGEDRSMIGMATRSMGWRLGADPRKMVGKIVPGSTA